MVLAMAHVGRATDQLNAELIRLADLLKARESVHTEVAALGGEVEPGRILAMGTPNLELILCQKIEWHINRINKLNVHFHITSSVVISLLVMNKI